MPNMRQLLFFGVDFDEFEAPARPLPAFPAPGRGFARAAPGEPNPSTNTGTLEGSGDNSGLEILDVCINHGVGVTDQARPAPCKK